MSHRSIWTPRPAPEVRVTFEGTRLEEFQKLSRDDPSAFAPPSAFGPFRVLHQVGVGALGPVFRTYEPTRDRLVAVKVFRLDITPEQAQNLADALSAAADAGLFHPSIVEPIAAGVEGTVAYRAEEYVAAESLDVALRHYAPAPMSRVLPFIAQLAGAIDFARASGVGHGALHPRDIFVTPEEARATGFGVVEALERSGLRAPVRRPYSAPERVSGGSWGTPADVFSLAAIAYELLTGKRPSGTGSEIGSLAGTAVGRESAPLVHAVLARGMHEDPDERYQTALQFASALDAASQGKATTAQTAAAAAGATAIPVATGANAADEKEAEDQVVDDVEDALAPAAADHDDIESEREFDDLHGTLFTADPVDAEVSDDAGLLADEHDEAVEDLALDPRDVAATERFADEFATASTAPQARHQSKPSSFRSEDDQEPFDPSDRYLGVAPAAATEAPGLDEPPARSEYFETSVAAHRSGPSWSAIAALLALAMLVGFVAGQMIGSRNAETVAENTEGGGSDRQSASDASTPAAAANTPAATTKEPAPPASTEPPAPVATTPAPAPPSRETAKPAPARSGTLTIRSQPSGANVTVNGKWRGRTPLTLEDVEFGAHEVRVVQQGYAVATEDVTLSSASPGRTLSFRLQRPPAPPPARSAPPPAPKAYTGAIYIDSLPRGAQVFLNGRAVGTTPVLVPDVPVGSQIVRLQMDEHRTWVTTARVVAGQQIKVSGSLERIR